MQEQSRILIRQCQQGDMNAFRQLMLRYQGQAFALAFRSLGDEDDANDVVQECFIRVWKNIKRFDTKRVFSTWLYRIVSNLCIDKLRQRGRQAVSFSSNKNYQISLPVLTGDDLEKEFDHQQLGDWINLLANGLTPKQRLVFVMRDLQGLNLEEISKTLKIGRGAVKSNLHLARRAIRKRLLEIEPELINGI